MGARNSLNLDQLDFVIGFMGQAIDFTPALKSVRQLVISETKENFDKTQDPSGTPWKPLKRPRSRKRDKSKRRRKGAVDKVLNDTGFLRASVTAFASPGNVAELTPTKMEWGSEVIYAAAHNFGIPSRNLPQREFLGFNAEMEADIEEIVGDYAERTLLQRLEA